MREPAPKEVSPRVSAPAATSTRTAELPLFQRFPALGDGVPRVRLAALPTPVERTAELGEHIGLPGLYVKRDDLTGGMYGGGKTRKLEFLLGDALQQSRRQLVTSGAVGSNHAVATAIYAKQLGLGTTLLLMPQAPSEHVRQNLLADYHHGAELRLVGSQRAVERATARLLQLSRPDAQPYVIPAGGSSALGNLSFVNAAMELEAQVQCGELPAPDVLYIAMGTMGCAVGLALGLKLTELPTRLVAVRVSNVPTSTWERFVSLFDATVAWLRERDPSFPALALRPGEVTLQGGYLGRGYAEPTRAGRRAVQVAREYGGLGVELTYTGKALAAVIDAAAELAQQNVLFWHTHSASEPATGEADYRQLPREFWPYFVTAARDSTSYR